MKYDKKRYLELLDQQDDDNNSNERELIRYSCMLTSQF